MTPEELLRPKWRVIRTYPGCPFKVGDIIKKHKFLSGKWYVPNFMYDPEDYTEIFKKLEWYEGLKPEEFPVYVKFDTKEVRKVRGGANDSFLVVGHAYYIHGSHLLPATREEYEAYQNTKT